MITILSFKGEMQFHESNVCVRVGWHDVVREITICCTCKITLASYKYGFIIISYTIACSHFKKNSTHLTCHWTLNKSIIIIFHFESACKTCPREFHLKYKCTEAITLRNIRIVWRTWILTASFSILSLCPR